MRKKPWFSCFLQGVVAALVVCSGSLAQAQLFTAPAGGWAYTYNGNSAAAPDDAALDGTWNHNNGSDEWDGTGPGAGLPGGAGVLTEGATNYLRIQDTGNPTDFGFTDPSNRKVYFTHDLSNAGAGANLLDTGVTMSFRARVAATGTLDDRHPAGGAATEPWPAGGDGSVIADSGKGNFGVGQSSGGVISFSLALPTDIDAAMPPAMGGLVMNSLNGTAVSGAVDTNEGTNNILPLADPTAWHEFWVVITQSGAGGTHRARVWLDGNDANENVTNFDVTAGSGNEGAFGTYLAMGNSSTGTSAAYDIDFVSIKPGVFFPAGPLVPGDVNGDGMVDVDGDFEPIRANFLQGVADRSDGDLNFDGLVNFDDFFEWETAFVGGGGSLDGLSLFPTPEPSTAALLMLACAIGAFRRR